MVISIIEFLAEAEESRQLHAAFGGATFSPDARKQVGRTNMHPWFGELDSPHQVGRIVSINVGSEQDGRLVK